MNLEFRGTKEIIEKVCVALQVLLLEGRVGSGHGVLVVKRVHEVTMGGVTEWTNHDFSIRNN